MNYVHGLCSKKLGIRAVSANATHAADQLLAERIRAHMGDEDHRAYISGLPWYAVLDIFAGGNFLFCFTAAIQCAPFNAILPEIVPASQVRPCTLKYTVPPLLSFISPTCLSAACAWCAQ